MKTNRERTAEYRQMKFPMGVFQIRNTVNGRLFLDSSLNMPALWNRHRFQLDLGNHPNRKLQEDWKTFGEPAFVFEVVEEILHDETKPDHDYRPDLKALEELWFDEKKPSGEAGYH